MQMSRQWMYDDQRSNEFINGMHYFIGVAEANKRNGFMSCPCAVCQNKKDYSNSSTLHIYQIRSNFMSGYNCWTKYKERGVIMEDNEEEEDDENYPEFPKYGGTSIGEDEEEVPDEPADDLGQVIIDVQRDCKSEKERLKFDRMLEGHNKLLYPNCEDGRKKLGSTLELLQ
jgi:hypothetical protein